MIIMRHLNQVMASMTIDGRGGYDEVNYTNSPSGMTIDLSQTTITDGWGNDRYYRQY